MEDSKLIENANS